MMPAIGLFAVNAWAAASARSAARIAELAEGLGYESLWVLDHVVLPSPQEDPSPMDPRDPVLDPVVALTFLAAHTERVRLGTGCVVLPQRNPLVLAKQLATVDVLSEGRLLFGAAAGYLVPELRAVGVSPEGRGARTDEYLRAIRSLWYDDEPAFHGEYVSFAGVDAHPRPVQRPVPVVIGGHSPAAHRRALTFGDEWFGFQFGLRAAAAVVPALKAAAADDPRRRDWPLRISLNPARPLDSATVAAYADLGVDRLIVSPPPGLSLAELERFVEANAPANLSG